MIAHLLSLFEPEGVERIGRMMQLSMTYLSQTHEDMTTIHTREIMMRLNGKWWSYTKQPSMVQINFKKQKTWA